MRSARSRWERLRWLVDFAGVLQQPESTAQAFDATEAAGLAPAMQHALLLAHDWLGLPADERRLAIARGICAGQPSRSPARSPLRRSGLARDAAARFLEGGVALIGFCICISPYETLVVPWHI